MIMLNLDLEIDSRETFKKSKKAFMSTSDCMKYLLP